MDITLLRLLWAEIAINGALMIANVAIHMKARRLLKSADHFWRDAIACRNEAARILEDAKQRAGK